MPLAKAAQGQRLWIFLSHPYSADISMRPHLGKGIIALMRLTLLHKRRRKVDAESHNTVDTSKAGKLISSSDISAHTSQSL